MSKPKYAEGDILQHKIEISIKRKIIYVYSVFYDETGISNDTYYQTTLLGNNEYPPSPISESAINKYYKKYDE
jgi:hypothetical protein